MKLHLGCNKRFLSGYTHIDLAEYQHINFKHDIRTLPMINTDSVDEIYASHVIDYFDRVEIIDILKEWYRVIKPGGIIRLAVPDFEAMATIYINNKRKGNNDPKKTFPLNGTDILFGRWEVKGYGFIYHKAAYDFLILEDLLKDIGFKNVKRWEFDEVFKDHINYDDYAQAYIPHMDKNGTLISLNVEAEK